MIFPRVSRCCVSGAVALVVVVVVPPAARADAPATAAHEWTRPVADAVTRPFSPPAHRFGPGHLGVDFGSAPGTPVRAAAAGTVTIAGPIAGALHIVIAHAGGLRTSYSFLASVRVHKGEHVRGGDVVGTSGGTGANHRADVLHFGLRVGAEYVDPMLLFGAVDLARVVHLAPTDEPFGFSASEERRSLLDGLRRGAGTLVRGVKFVARGVESVADASAGGLTFDPLTRLAHDNVGLALGRGLLGYIDERRKCNASAPAADGNGGSAHRVMVVAGIDSHTDGHGRTLGLPVAELGYRADEVSYFSYAADGGRYERKDTYSPILASADKLGEQLRDLQRREPGREVDLIAHSQGGVVTLAFLKLVYRSGDPSYPPLGTVVTLSSPLAGAPIAGLVGDVRGLPGGDALVAGADHVAGDGVPDLTSAAVRDLDPDSELMHRLDDAPLPDDAQITTIGSTYDYVVPGNRATSRDATERTVIETVVGGAHTHVVDDADALRATRAALEGAPLPCRSFSQYVRAELVPHAISSLEPAGSNHVFGGRR